MLVREGSFVNKSTGQSWQGVSRRLRDTIIRHYYNLSGLENYTVGHSSDVEQIWFHDED